MLNVLTGGDDDDLLISATIELESMPPERNAPSGTSAMSCRSTAVWSADLNASAASASVQSRSCTSAASQYRCTVACPSRYFRKCAGGTLCTPLSIVRGAMTYS